MLDGDNLPRHFIDAQCKEWERMLKFFYVLVTQYAKKYELIAGLTSMIIIVLNVLIVGKGDLKLHDLTVAFFVVAMTILKAVQVQFAFAAICSELGNSLALLRSTTFVVVERLVWASQGLPVTYSEYIALREKVKRAEAGVPSWVMILPTNTDEPQKKKARDPYGCGLICGFLRWVTEVKASLYSGKGKADSEEANGEDNSGKGKVCSEEALSEQMESTPSAPPRVLLTGASSAHTPKPPPVFKSTTSHLSAPPIDDVDVEAVSPRRSLQVDGVHTAADGVQGSGGATLCEERAYQKQILTDMATTLKPAAISLGFFVSVAHTIATIQTTVELLLNAIIMIISAVPDDSFVNIGRQKNAILAIVAAINGVLKGIDMKLQFEKRAANLSTAFKALKTAQNKVKNAIAKLHARQDQLLQAEFNECKEEFQHLVDNYASWLKDKDEQDKV
jgi:hypothetical protein